MLRWIGVFFPLNTAKSVLSLHYSSEVDLTMCSSITPNLKYLTMHRDQFLAHINDTSRTFDKVTVGGAILQFTAAGPQILLLKRRDDERYYPGVFEIPCGKVDATDTTIRDAVVREVLEESKLVVTGVVHPLSVMTYTPTKPTVDAGKESDPIVRHAIQLSYVVTVKCDTDIKVNKEEHSLETWINREVLGDLSITHEMRDLVLEALSWGETK